MILIYGLFAGRIIYNQQVQTSRYQHRLDQVEKQPVTTRTPTLKVSVTLIASCMLFVVRNNTRFKCFLRIYIFPLL